MPRTNNLRNIVRQEVRKVFPQMVQKGQAMVDLLDNHAPSGTPYAQVGTILIRKCIHPRMIHLMRAIYREDSQEALADADQALNESESDGSNRAFACFPQREQPVQGTAVTDDPVSTITANDCGGVPTRSSVVK